MEEEKVEITHQNKADTGRKNLGFLAGISLAVVVVVGATSWWAINTITTSNKPSIPTMLIPGSDNNQRATDEKIAEIYWIKTTDTSLEFVPIPVTMEQALPAQVNLEAAMRRLLAGVNSPDYNTVIPKGTKLLNISVRGNEVFVNLSQDFTTGGGSASMIGRLGQVIYTATSLNPRAKVWLQVEGKTLDVLGGEGVMLDQPLTRQYFEANMLNFAE